MSRPDDATRVLQAKATDPARSVWVTANAGSGKTFVLSRRVIRLLLSGTEPSRILCLTFTKAAAAEMARRVFDELGRWTALSDVELSDAIAELEGMPPAPRRLVAARRLFARALDTPGGLKIQTIHAFCERLLHQFPFEANVPGHFEVLDDRTATELKDEARRMVLARAAAEPHGTFGAALATIVARVSDRTFEDSLEQFIDARDRLRTWIAAADGIESSLAGLKATLGVEQSAAELRGSFVADSALDLAEARRLVDRLSASGTNDQKSAERLRPFVEAAEVAARHQALIDFFFTDEGKPRSAPVTKKFAKDWPGLEDLLAGEGARLAALRQRILTAELFEMSAAMLRLADSAIAEYQRLKASRGALDFEDLIVGTANLLARVDADRWVHYKLDRGIDHVLVDEAQDTSPRQWQVISSLVGEFFAGEGAAGGRLRTLFAVGDEKQSIYSFQGAVPAWFAYKQREFALVARGGNYAWENAELHISFRSVPKVLAAVDAVFAEAAMHRGLNALPAPTIHNANRHAAPGRVLLWPVETAPEKQPARNWTDALDHLGDESPEVKLARRIAATVAGWLARRELLDAPDAKGAPRPIRAGEILILTRSRGALTDAINRELKHREVPIAGADRLHLGEHIAVMDLVAAAKVALLAEDDLTLAAVLKSPLIGLDDDALFRLAHGRIGSLWQALAAASEPAFVAAREKIERWQRRADRHDPHAFFAAILAADGGRHALRTRLGAEADDVLDEFLAQALAYEQANTPSLQGFLAWFEATDTEVKRDLDAARDEVRVMTVHGAKGLEADIVFLVDNGTLPVIANYVSSVVPLKADAGSLTPVPVVWNYSTPAMPEGVLQRTSEQKERDEEEYRRLLYVGMTRARDRLYVVGMSKQKSNDDRRWHPRVFAALESGFTKRTLADGAVEYEWRADPAPSASAAAAPPESPRAAVPAWLRQAAPAAPAALRRLTPSSLAGGADAAPPVAAPAAVSGRVQAEALERGRVVHRLLQSLPDVAPGRRAETAATYVAAVAPQWPPAARAALVAEVMAVLADPAFAEALSPGSRAEVEIAGRLGDAVVSGRIDRLAVSDRRVLIVDYKTNRPAPRDSAAVPPQYIDQLALYRAVLSRCYPGRTVAAALVWTDGPFLMPIPVDLLDVAEKRLRSVPAA
jgi:ATP-dependent helicase/nuclease subunit A